MKAGPSTQRRERDRPLGRRVGAVLRGLLLLALVVAVLWDALWDAPPRAVPPQPGSFALPPTPSPAPVRATPLPRVTPAATARSTPLPPTPAVTTEALGKIGATAYHARGYVGQGVKVAVIDTQFAHVTELLEVGELPPNLVTRRFLVDGVVRDMLDERGGSHGTACAEVIHDIAPGAQLYLIQVERFTPTLAPVLDYLHAEGVRVVSISIAPLSQGRGDGRGLLGDPPVPVYALLDEAYRNRDMLIVKSAGNYARQHYSGPFTDLDGDGWHEFGIGRRMQPDEDVGLLVRPDEVLRLYLSWDDWGDDPQTPGATHDYAIYVFDEEGREVTRSPQTQDGAQPPVDVVTLDSDAPTTYAIRIRRQGAVTRTSPMAGHHLDLFVKGAVTALSQYQVREGSLSPPADARSVVAVGAANVANDTLVSYSSWGPTADGRTKPDVTSYAYVSVTTPDASAYGFAGTSSAAPHVAGMAALLLSASGAGELPAPELRSELLRFAADKGPPGKDNAWGFGLARLPPLDAQVRAMGVREGIKFYLDVAVQRADGTSLPGLLPADFEVRFGTLTAPLVSVRELSDRYRLEARPPPDVADGAHTVSVTVLGSTVALSQAVSVSGDTHARARLLTLDVALDAPAYRTGDGVTLLASLADAAPIADARLSVTVFRPDDTTDTLVLLDDGMHCDGVAGDGVYGGLYTHAQAPGAYRFAVVARHQDRTRRADLDVPVHASAFDSDGDGMPDNWEAAVGLNVTFNDAYRDPDGDGLANLEEYRQGTDPFNWDTDEDTLNDRAERTGYYETNPANPDTDLGGADDALELRNGTNPLDPADDAQNRFIVYLPPVMRTYVPTPRPVRRAVAQGDRLWIATEGGVVRWHRPTRRYVKFTPYDGLPHAIVHDLALDGAGRVWAATEGGVAVYDGQGWAAYTTAHGLPHDLVRAVAVGPEGALWAGTAGGVASFDGDRWSRTTTTADGLAHDDVYDLAVDDAGRIWVGTRAGVSFRGAEGPWRTLGTADGLAKDWVTAVAIDGEGHRWFGTWGGGVTEVYAGAEAPTEEVWTTHTAEDGLASDFVHALSRDAQGRVWIHAEREISVRQDGAWTTYTAEDSVSYGLPAGTYYARVTEPSGRTWLRRDAAETLPDALRIPLDAGRYQWFGAYSRHSYAVQPPQRLAVPPGFPQDPEQGAAHAVYALALDGQGGLWVGTGAGVHHFDGATWTLHLVHPEDLGKNWVHALAVDGAGHVWAGTEGGGVRRFDGRTWRAYTPHQGLVSWYIDAVAVAPGGVLWFGSGDGHGGVSRFAADDATPWTTYTPADGLASHYVNAAGVDGAGDVWFGTDEGVSRLTPPRAGAAARWTTFTAADGLAHNQVWAIVEAPAGPLAGMWFGTSGGLSRYRGGWSTPEVVAPAGAGDPVRAPVRALAVGPDGRLWAGTQDGVGVYGGTGWTVHRAGEEVWALAVDGDAVWVGTARGVTRLGP